MGSMIGALGQILAGRRRTSTRTPPFVGGRGVPGTPAAPTPGMPLPMPGASQVPGGTAGLQPRTGVLGMLQNPNVAATALAAAQQLTRPRYAGETGMGNAVSAVTAGFNQLVQQKALQQARELAAEERRTKNSQWEREQTRKDSDTSNQNRRRDAQTVNEDEDRVVRREINETDRQYKERTAKVAEQNAASTKQNADSLETSRGAELAFQQERLAQAAASHKLEREKFDEAKSQFDRGLITKDQLEQKKLAVDWAQVGVARERNTLLRAKAGELSVDVKLWGAAVDDATNIVKLQASQEFPTEKPTDRSQQVQRLAEELYQKAKSKRSLESSASEDPGSENPYRKR